MMPPTTLVIANTMLSTTVRPGRAVTRMAAALAQARAEAIATAGEMLRDAGLRSWDGSEGRMLVRDEESRTVLSLRVSAE